MVHYDRMGHPVWVTRCLSQYVCEWMHMATWERQAHQNTHKQTPILDRYFRAIRYANRTALQPNIKIKHRWIRKSSDSQLNAFDDWTIPGCVIQHWHAVMFFLNIVPYWLSSQFRNLTLKGRFIMGHLTCSQTAADPS